MSDEKTYKVQQVAVTPSRGTIYRHLGKDVKA